MKYNVFRVFDDNSSDFLFSFETLKNAQVYVESKKRMSPMSNFLIVKEE